MAEVSESELTWTRREMLVERLLVDLLGVPWAYAHEEAGAIAMVVSDHVEQCLVRVLGDPGTCPHGNPIPGSSNMPDHSAARPASDVLGLVHVTRVSPRIEGDLSAMSQLEACGIMPGSLAEIVEHGAIGTRVIGASANLVLPADLARQTYVTPLQT